MKQFSWRLSKKNIRFIGWSLFGLFFLTVCLPLLFFYYFFDQNSIKQMIVSQINNQNYSVKIDGTIEPRSWHGLSLFIADLTVFDKLNNKAIHINTTNCQLSWLDLIVGHYRIRRIAMNGLTVFQNSVDKHDYSDLINYDSLAHSEFKNLKKLSISNLTLISKNGDYLIKDATLSAIDLDTTTPEMELGLNLSKYNANLKFNGHFNKVVEGNSLEIKNLDVSFTNPSYKVALQSGGHYDFHTQELWLEGARGNISMPNYQGGLTADTALLSFYGLTINNLQTTLNGVGEYSDKSISTNILSLKTVDFESYSADSLVGSFDLQNKHNSLNLSIKVKHPAINGSLVSMNQLCQVGYKYSSSQNNKPSDGNLQGKCSFEGNKNLIMTNLTGNIDKSQAKIAVSYDYSESIPFVQVNGELSKFDIDTFVAAKENSFLPVYADNSLLPFKWLNLLNGKANIKINQLNLERMTLNNVNSSFTISNGKLDISNMDADAYDGKIDGSMIIDRNSESYGISLKSNVHGVNLQKVFNNLFNVSAITGNANILIDTSIKGVSTYKELYNKLNGKVKLNVSDGGFSGIDFNLFLSPENLAAFRSQTQIMTNFTALEANFGFANGVSEQGEITFNSPTIMANGNGKVDFVKNQLNYNLIIKSILPKNAQNIKSVSIPIAINGELFNPKIYIKNMTLNTTTPKTKKNNHTK